MGKTYRKLSKNDKKRIRKFRKLKTKKYEEAYKGDSKDDKKKDED